MKPTAIFAGMGLLATAAGFAQMGAPAAPDAAKSVPPPADSVRIVVSKEETAPKKDATNPAAKKAPPAPAKKKEEPPAQVEGVAIARAKGGFLGLRLVNNNFVLTFYDEKKKKIAPDVARAAFRWPVKYQPGPERAVLNPDGGVALVSSKFVKPPLTFKLFISLFAEGSDEAVENYTVDFHGE